jgi:hypothetical protein
MGSKKLSEQVRSTSTADPFGDFQTPVPLAREVWSVIDLHNVDLIVEPTVGVGGFAVAAPPAAVGKPWLAWEINEQHVAAARTVMRERGISAFVEPQDVFDLSRESISHAVTGKSVLAIGNPPWVTNSAQSRSSKTNLPIKQNGFGLLGLDAMTGKANFDIAEAVLLALMNALSDAKEIRFAFLVKRSVAMKMARDLLETPGITDACFSRIDAKRWFGASVEAGLFQISIHPTKNRSCTTIELRDGLGGQINTIAGYHAGIFVGNLAAYREASSIEATPGQGLEWRQGLKHDLARVLELKRTPVGFKNGYGESVDIEPAALCPLFKSSDLAHGRNASRWIPLYQYDLSGPITDLDQRWPKLAAYLALHRDKFLARKSQIYRGKPDFILFGVGPYTSAPYKVAISGFYKESTFRVLGPGPHETPPLVDDTCYLLPFECLAEAETMGSYLNGAEVQAFLASIADRTAKRPYTKEVLRRIHNPNTTDATSPSARAEASLNLL